MGGVVQIGPEHMDRRLVFSASLQLVETMITARQSRSSKLSASRLIVAPFQADHQDRRRVPYGAAGAIVFAGVT